MAQTKIGNNVQSRQPICIYFVEILFECFHLKWFCCRVLLIYSMFWFYVFNGISSRVRRFLLNEYFASNQNLVSVWNKTCNIYTSSSISFVFFPTGATGPGCGERAPGDEEGRKARGRARDPLRTFRNENRSSDFLPFTILFCAQNSGSPKYISKAFPSQY